MLYSFTIIDPDVKDPRLIRNNKIIQACLLIIFPVHIDAFASRSRKEISTEIQSWLRGFKTVKDIKMADITTIQHRIEKLLLDKQALEISRERHDEILVTARNFQLLEKVAEIFDKKITLLILGTSSTIFAIVREGIVRYCLEDVLEYKVEGNVISVKFQKVEVSIVHLSEQNPSGMKYVQRNIDGVLYYADFSTKESAEFHQEELKKVIHRTGEQCTIGYSFIKNDEPIIIAETMLPTILSEAIGRSVVLIDLAQSGMSIELALIEFLEKVINSITID